MSTSPEPHSAPSSEEPFLQIESWDADGRSNLLAIVQKPGGATAWLVSRDLVGGGWLTGSAKLPSSPAGHDRAAAVAAITVEPASGRDLRDLGFADGRMAMGGRIVGYVNPDRPRWKTGSWRAGMDVQSKGFVDSDKGIDVDVALAATLGFQRSGDSRFSSAGRQMAPTTPQGTILPTPPDLATLGTSTTMPLRIEPGVELSRAIDEALSIPLGAMMREGDREAFAVLGDWAWSSEAHAFYSQPGRVGGHRRQAAGVYPALKTVFAHCPEVSELVDRGRPYEEAVCDALKPLLDRPDLEGLSVAKLRRLRPLIQGSFANLRDAVRLSARLPVDWLPKTDAGWSEMLKPMTSLSSYAESVGASLRGLLGHAGGDWRKVAGPGSKYGAILSGASDMANSLADTLVSPVLRAMGIPENRIAERQMAGTMLFEGRSLTAIDKTQARWHTGLSVLNAAMPAWDGDGEGNQWTAAFKDYVAPNGLLITCLTNEIDLKHEGMKGLDPDGIAGLDHCIGGYALDCFEGISHLASIRSVKDGVVTRVSSVEFRFTNGVDANGGLTVVQHMAKGNGYPGRDATKALDRLQRDIQSGAHPLNVEGLRVKSDVEFRAGYDFTKAGNLDQAFAAWGIYLPRDIAHRGLDALRERIAPGFEAPEPEEETRPGMAP